MPSRISGTMKLTWCRARAIDAWATLMRVRIIRLLKILLSMKRRRSAFALPYMSAPFGSWHAAFLTINDFRFSWPIIMRAVLRLVRSRSLSALLRKHEGA